MTRIPDIYHSADTKALWLAAGMECHGSLTDSLLHFLGVNATASARCFSGHKVYSISDILNQTSKWDRPREQKSRCTCSLLGANTLRYPSSNSRCSNYLLCHLPLGFSDMEWRTSTDSIWQALQFACPEHQQRVGEDDDS